MPCGPYSTPGKDCWNCDLPSPYCDCPGDFESFDDRQIRCGLMTRAELDAQFDEIVRQRKEQNK